MNVSELYDLTYWISEEIEDVEILKKYQALQTIIQQHTMPNQQKNPFEAEKEILISALQKVPLEQLSRDQIVFLEHLGIANLVGEVGNKNIEDVLYKNVIDVATSAIKLKDNIGKLSNGINKSNQIKTGLSDCVFEEKYETDNDILMRIIFTGNAQMENINDFKNWGKKWYDIGRGVSMVNNASPEEFKIIGASKGSIVLELAIIGKIAATVSGILLAALKVAEKVLDIRKKAEELKALKLNNEQLYKDLENEAKNQKDEGIKEITINISTELNINQKDKGDKVKALDTAVKNLVDFVEKGGVVDFIVPDDDEDILEDKAIENKELRVAFQEIRQLENKIAKLEHKEHD